MALAIGCTAPGGGGPTPPGDDPDAGAPGSTDADPGTPNAFDCSPAGIAAYADALVVKARTSCTQDGVGVVKQDDYNCMKPAIDQVAPPHADTSFNVVSTLLANNTAYPFYECTYFVQTVTAGVCNVPISPSTRAWTDYPFACEFIHQSVAGFQWIDKTNGVVKVGDILLYNSSDNCQNDPGHIMIVAAVMDANHFRVAEANELTPSGSPASTETGVVSNTRIETLDDPYLANGWFRQTGH